MPFAGVLTVVVLTLVPRAAAALPELRAGERLEPPLLQLLVPSADRLQIRVAVGADIDADGDVDVVAATDRDLVVWINDGRGQFRRRAAHRHPVADGPPAPDTWSGDGPAAAEAVLAGTVLMPLIVVRAHAPPIDIASQLLSVHATVRSDVCVSSRTSRAPPSHA
ncbi:MAG TPA: VCBS repeat-containing protein [Vicinamibacterales bacterium]